MKKLYGWSVLVLFTTCHLCEKIRLIGYTLFHLSNFCIFNFSCACAPPPPQIFSFQWLWMGKHPSYYNWRRISSCRASWTNKMIETTVYRFGIFCPTKCLLITEKIHTHLCLHEKWPFLFHAITIMKSKWISQIKLSK